MKKIQERKGVRSLTWVLNFHISVKKMQTTQKKVDGSHRGSSNVISET